MKLTIMFFLVTAIFTGIFLLLDAWICGVPLLDEDGARIQPEEQASARHASVRRAMGGRP